MKNINDFTIREYYDFIEAVRLDDIVWIYELFGLELTKLPYNKFEQTWSIIKNSIPTPAEVKSKYKIKGKTYKLIRNPLKLKASQYIDFQNYMAKEGYELQEIISVFLIPRKKKYNQGYDILELQNIITENMTISEAMGLSTFFLNWSTILMRSMKASLEKERAKVVTKHLHG